MKYLFLDIDGVLWTGFYKGRSWKRFTPPCVAELNELIDLVPDMEIVISSVWRIGYTLPELRRHFKKCGFKAPKLIVSKTPRMDSRVRGDEIQAWMTEHNVSPMDIVILDDDADMAHLLPRLVQTQTRHGLTEKEVLEVKHTFDRTCRSRLKRLAFQREFDR